MEDRERTKTGPVVTNQIISIVSTADLADVCRCVDVLDYDSVFVEGLNYRFHAAICGW